MNSHLRTLRSSRGLMLKDAASEFGIDSGNLSRIERGKQQPSVALARRMSAFYGVTLDEIFGPAHGVLSRPAPTAPREAA